MSFIQEKGYVEKLKTLLAPYMNCKSPEEVLSVMKQQPRNESAEVVLESEMWNNIKNRISSFANKLSSGASVVGMGSLITGGIAWTITQGALWTLITAVGGVGLLAASIIFWLVSIAFKS